VNTLMIFLKEPVAGQVKTRLAKSLDSEKACNIYRGFLQMIVEKLITGNWQTQVFYASQGEPKELKRIFPSSIEFIEQQGDNLGERMQKGFETNFKRGATKVTIIGGDSPDMPLDFIQQSFHSLSTQDLTLGPTPDGGYYLMGLKKNSPFLFEEIEWSTPAVLPSTLKIAHAHHLKILQLPQWNDVDDIEDYQDFIKSNPHFTPHYSQ